MEKKSKAKAKKVMGLRGAIFLATFLTSIVPIGLLSTSNYMSTKALVMSNNEAMMKSHAKQNSQYTTAWFAMAKNAVTSAAMSKEVVSSDLPAGTAYLSKVQKQYPWIYAFFVINEEGMQVSRTDANALSNIADREYVKPVKAGAPFGSQVAVSRGTGKMALLMAAYAGVGESGKVFLGAGANMDQIVDQVVGDKFGTSGSSFLIAKDGTYFAHKDSKMIGKPAKLDAGANGTVALGELDGKAVYTLRASVEDSDLTLVSQIDADEVDKPLQNIKENFIAMMLGALALSGLASYLIGGRIGNSISEVARISSNLSTAKNIEEINKLDKELSEVSGVSETLQMREAVRRLASSIKLAMQALR